MTPITIDQVHATFSFLLDEYGFRPAGEERTKNDLVVKFKNDTTGIEVHIGCHWVGVTIARLDRAGRFRTFERDDFGRWWWIVQDVIPTKAERERLARTDDDVAALGDHAEALRRYGDAVLRGDFTAVEGVDWWQMREAPVNA
jgi:hypothetical protein